MSSKLSTTALTTISFPLYEVWHQAIKSSAAATIFIVLLIIVLSFTCLAAQQTSSRLIWSFARDDALLFSNRLKRLHPRLNVPVWALLYSWFWAFILGCIYLGSSTAFNAIVAPGLILEQISFAIPSALLIWQHREQRFLPSSGWCKLGRWGWIVNFTSVIWALVELVFYSLPPQLPVNGDNMSEPACVGLLWSCLRADLLYRLHVRRTWRRRDLDNPQLDLLCEAELPRTHEKCPRGS